MNGLKEFIGNFAFSNFLSITLSLTVNFVLFVLSMPNENMIMVTKLNPSYRLHNSNQAK